VQDESQTELLLDVIGDNEPIEMARSEFKHAFETARYQSPSRGSNQRSREPISAASIAECESLSDSIDDSINDSGSDSEEEDDDVESIYDDDDAESLHDTNAGSLLLNNARSLLLEENSLLFDPTVKREEFDTGDLLVTEQPGNEVASQHCNEIVVCPASPDSQPASPSSSSSDANSSSISTDYVQITTDLCEQAEREVSLVGNPSYDGYGLNVDGDDDDQFLSCSSSDMITMNNLDDPFSELFPSLISV